MATQSRFDGHILIDNRQVRIFLSSTFSDMQEERTALLKTFDALRVKAHRRNVDLTVLDLRWGVTDEEARSGKVISVCLNEIEHSHPFFIGLLGSRYGYAPDADELTKSPDLLERYPWIADDIRAGRSITEMEMLYGVLRNEGNVDAAFYIRQNGTPDDDPRQTALKERIRGQQRYPVADYASVDELCAMVEHEVTALLDRHFPDVEATPLERERTAHRAYANSLLGHFVGREEELGWLDAFVRSTERHLVVTGESGMGKSALLARWCRQNEESDDFNLVYHFVGNSLGSSSYEGILRHLCDEIYTHYGIEKKEQNDGQREKPEDEAQRLVAEVMQREKPLVVVLDGINQLSAPKDEKLLLWLPAANAQVQFIFTTLQDDATMHTFERRGYAVRTLLPLSDGQRRRFAEGYLERVGKHLSHAQWQRIMDDPENQNTLVLRTLLDELICFGSHEQLDARIDFYLAAQGIEDFFDRVLQRYEQDYGRDLVSRTLALLALSERGLSEEELLAIAGLRQMDWHLFYCAAYNHLVVRDGLIIFAHQYVATAVASRYATADASASAPLRRATAAYFAALPPSDRRTSELAHQYYHLADWQHLHDTLVSFDAFYYFHNTNDPLLALYWRALLKAGYSLRVYLQLPHSAEDDDLATEYNIIGLFINVFFADYNLALEYYDKALAIKENILGPQHPSTGTLYNNIGKVYSDMGDSNKALEYLSTSLMLKEKKYGLEHPETAWGYSNIGMIHLRLDNFTKALEYSLKALSIREKSLGLEHPETAGSYTNISSIYYFMGDYQKALEYANKALYISEKVLGIDHIDTASTYYVIGRVYKGMKDYLNASYYFRKALNIREEILGENHPSTSNSYKELGAIEYLSRHYTVAMSYYAKALSIRSRLLGDNHPLTAEIYHEIGLIYDKWGQYADALEYQEKALSIDRKVYGEENTSTAEYFQSIGVVYYHQDDKTTAYYYIRKALRIFEIKLGSNHPRTVSARGWVEGIESEWKK